MILQYTLEKAPSFVPASPANVIPLDQYKHIVKEVGREEGNEKITIY